MLVRVPEQPGDLLRASPASGCPFAIINIKEHYLKQNLHRLAYGLIAQKKTGPRGPVQIDAISSLRGLRLRLTGPRLGDHFFRLQQEPGKGRQQPDRPDHIPEEHEEQQDAHVGLELDR